MNMNIAAVFDASAWEDGEPFNKSRRYHAMQASTACVELRKIERFRTTTKRRQPEQIASRYLKSLTDENMQMPINIGRSQPPPDTLLK